MIRSHGHGSAQADRRITPRILIFGFREHWLRNSADGRRSVEVTGRSNSRSILPAFQKNLSPGVRPGSNSNQHVPSCRTEIVAPVRTRTRQADEAILPAESAVALIDEHLRHHGIIRCTA